MKPELGVMFTNLANSVCWQPASSDVMCHLCFISHDGNTNDAPSSFVDLWLPVFQDLPQTMAHLIMNMGQVGMSEMILIK